MYLNIILIITYSNVDGSFSTLHLTWNTSRRLPHFNQYISILLSKVISDSNLCIQNVQMVILQLCFQPSKATRQYSTWYVTVLPLRPGFFFIYISACTCCELIQKARRPTQLSFHEKAHWLTKIFILYVNFTPLSINRSTNYHPHIETTQQHTEKIEVKCIYYYLEKNISRL